MDATTIVQRKKLGRPPKATATVKATDSAPISGGGGIAFMQSELGDEAALVAISPIPDEQSSATTPGIMDTSGECRRSSRKKIIKFDVRDLLNKHRKPHKIQIEARIDSNAPSVSSKVVPTTGDDLENNATGNKEKCFIEKTSIIQRPAFDNAQHGSTQVPIPLKTQIFKPNQSSSLIVAQMESISSSNQSLQKHPKSIACSVDIANKLNTCTGTDIIVPKRRGRPPKNRSLTETPKEEEVKLKPAAATEINITNEEKISETVKDPQNEAVAATESSGKCIWATSFQGQFEKSLLKSDELVSEPATKSTVEPNIGLTQINEGSSLGNMESISDCPSETQSTKTDTKESDNVPPSTTSTIVITIEDSLSNSDVLPPVNVEKQRSIEEEKTIVVEKPRSVTADLSESVCQEKGPNETRSNITLPIKKQISKLQDMQAEFVEEKSATDIPMTKDILLRQDSEGTRNTSTPTPQRSERRSGRRLGEGSNKTLEETFAEIAANSSKEILDMTTQNVDECSALNDSKISELKEPESVGETVLPSDNSELSKNENVLSLEETQTALNESESSQSVSFKEEISEQSVPLIKRRGRKPKPKPLAERDDSVKDAIKIDQQSFEKPVDTHQIESAENLYEVRADELKEELTLFDMQVLKDNQNAEQKDAEKIVEELVPLNDVQQKQTLVIDSISFKATVSSDEKQHEHKAKKKSKHEETSPSKKSSGHHKYRSHEEHKSDQKLPKNDTLSLEKIKKHRSNDDKEEANGRKSLESSKKYKLPAKERSSEMVSKKTFATSESSKKSRERLEDADARKISSKKPTVVSLENLPLDNQQIPSTSKVKLPTDDVKRVSSFTKEKSESESTKRSAVDSLKKSTLLSPERAADDSYYQDASSVKEKCMLVKDKFEGVKKSMSLTSEKPSLDSNQKSSKMAKERFMDDIRKQHSISKEKLGSEGNKKPSSATKEKHSIESHTKKSSSKEKSVEESSKNLSSTPEDRRRKSIFLPKEKIADSLKKVSSTFKGKSAIEENAFEEALISSHLSEKKHHDKKKNKQKLLETSFSTSKIKAATSSSVPSTPSSISKECSLTKTSSSSKHSDDKSHKRKRKHKDSLETTGIKDTCKSQESIDEKMAKSTESTDEKKQLKKELKDAMKLARKERQKKLTEAFKAAMEENSDKEKTSQPHIQGLNIPDQRPITPEVRNEPLEITLPPTPGESEAGMDINEEIVEPPIPVQQPVQSTEEKPKAIVESDPLYDIEKFIEAGVNLLKRDYKLAEDDEEVKAEGDETQEPMEEQKVEPAIKVENPAAVDQQPDNDIPETPSAIENIEAKTELSSALDFYETPVDTPASTPASVTPSSSPTPTENSVDTYYYSDGVRRSHRLKKITNAPKALVGRGLVRDRDRERLAMRDDVETKSFYSIEDHLMDLAEVEAKNAKFLKEMEERLSNFEVIKENEYHCERIVSREARKMVCDCFLTSEEAERGELGCGEDCLNRLLMIECGVNCKVGERCTNKRFQKYLCAPCRVFRTEKKGFGIMADVEIHPGEFIMEYVGEVLDSDEFEERRVAYSQDKNRHYYFMALRSDAIIDATIKGNVSRFINHSCDPNAETQKWTVNGELRIGFFSRKTIMPGEEITFDYQYQRYGREAQRCYCESANCRGWIGEEPASDEGEQVDDEEDDDDDDEDEYDEDESDVVSMVKGLMSVEDGEDDDGKDDIMSEETRRTIQDAAVQAQLRKNQSLESEAASVKEPSLEGETDESKQKFMAYLSKISAKIELHKKNVREEKKRKRQQRKKAASERRPPTTATTRFLEDPDLEDEIDFLSRCGLKNQSDTLRLSRLMVRAKHIPTRLNLLAILRAGELPCRRLFLDYHGLHLLHGWINADGRTDMSIRMALLETLESLPIPNKTILTESKVYQAVRGWCSKTEPKNDGSSSSPSDDSSKESASGNAGEKQPSSDDAKTITDDTESPSSELEKLASKLLNSWDNLPEIFRIPKRERIEQMKEHEREADRQYAATVENDEKEDQKEVSTDRYQRDRFERRFGRPQGSRTISVLGAGALGLTGKRLNSSDVLSPEDTKHLSKEQRRELFAAKVARDEAEKRQAECRREFETKCTFFGLDPLVTKKEDIPFCVSDSGQWFNERRQTIATPPAFAHVQTPSKPKSTNPTDYYLPSAATKLPPEWTYAITDQGKIYYYHLKHRIPQWEPPTTEQINKTKWSDGESESEEDETEDNQELSEDQIKEIEAIETQEELNAYLKKIVQEQRQSRYKRLVDECPISPRREEDRIYNQIEMRKYKENKEKIKKRKEEIRRRRSEAIKNSMLNMCTLGSLEEKPTFSGALSLENIKTEPESADMPSDALPIQDYLLSSDEDNNDIDEMKAECNNSPLLDKIVQGDKIVDELDALTTKRQLKRPLPPHREFNFDLNIPSNLSSESLLASLEKIEQKKRKQEKKEKSKRSKDSGDAKYRKLKEKFRCEIAGIIVQHLKPYRKDSCIFGRIKSNDDFNHLAKKLTHFVMIKELKYCESVGQTLVVTESVKNKSREFIRKYMAKYETGYVKPNNDPEFKDIPYTL